MPTREQVNTDSPQALANKTLAAPIISGGTITLPTINSPLINTGTAGADPTVPLGLATKQYADALFAAVQALLFSTGDLKPTYKAVADPGWIMLDEKSIGSAASGATGRANADTANLFALLWNNVVNQYAPVSGGRGASAAADFAANKTLTLPQSLGRVFGCAGLGATSVSGVDADVNIGTDTFTVPGNAARWNTGMAVTFTLTSGTITGLVSGTGYFVIRNGTTGIKLATTLQNAQGGVAIDLTAKSTPVWTITNVLTGRALGEALGEETHAMTPGELLPHVHTTGIPRGNNGSTLPNVAAGADGTAGTGTYTSSSGTGLGNAGMNILGPTTFANWMIKL